MSLALSLFFSMTLTELTHNFSIYLNKKTKQQTTLCFIFISSLWPCAPPFLTQQNFLRYPDCIQSTSYGKTQRRRSEKFLKFIWSGYFECWLECGLSCGVHKCHHKKADIWFRLDTGIDWVISGLLDYLNNPSCLHPHDVKFWMTGIL